MPAEFLPRRILTDQRSAAQKVTGEFQTALLMRRSQHANARSPGTQRPFGRGFPHAGCQKAYHRAAAAGDLICQPLSHFDAVGAGFPCSDHRDHRQKVEGWEQAFHIKNRRRACDPAQPLRKLRCVIRENGNLLLRALFQKLIDPFQGTGFQQFRLLGRDASFPPKAALLRAEGLFRAVKHPHHRGTCLRTDIQL